MLIKEMVLGIKCELVPNRREVLRGETRISINGKEILVKTEHLTLLKPIEKFAVCGESPVLLNCSGIISLIGPTSTRNYLVRTNSRGYVKEFFVKENDVLFRNQ
ncbi:MAG: hypothetical protein ABH840_03920 [Nanoarchaeota archaeon]